MAAKSSPAGEPVDGSGCPPKRLDDPTVPRRLARLKRRRDFLAAARARKSTSPAFVLQARRRDPAEICETEGARMGFTASKKVGNAVARNRAKRRLRALADAVGPEHARPGWDYVLIGRAETTASRNFALMRAELEDAFARVHSSASASGSEGKRGRSKRRGGAPKTASGAAT